MSYIKTAAVLCCVAHKKRIFPDFSLAGRLLSLFDLVKILGRRAMMGATASGGGKRQESSQEFLSRGVYGQRFFATT